MIIFLILFCLVCARLDAASAPDLEERDCARVRLLKKKSVYQSGMNLMSAMRRRYEMRYARCVWQDVFGSQEGYSFSGLSDILLTMMYDGYDIVMDFEKEMVRYQSFSVPYRKDVKNRSWSVVQFIRQQREHRYDDWRYYAYCLYAQGLKKYTPKEVKNEDLYLALCGRHPGLDFRKDTFLNPTNDRLQRVRDYYRAKFYRNVVVLNTVGLIGERQGTAVPVRKIWAECQFGEGKDYNYAGFCRVLEPVLEAVRWGVLLAVNLETQMITYHGCSLSMGVAPKPQNIERAMCLIMRENPKIDTRVMAYLLCDRYNLCCTLEAVRLKEEALFTCGIADPEDYKEVFGCAHEERCFVPRWVGEEVFRAAFDMRDSGVIRSLKEEGLATLGYSYFVRAA